MIRRRAGGRRHGYQARQSRLPRRATRITAYLTNGGTLEKAAGNFCEYFEFARREWRPKSETNSREAAAREKLKKLFGD